MNRNMSVWIAEAAKYGIDLSILHQDKTKIYTELSRLGLPVPEAHVISQEQLASDELEQITEGRIWFCRLIPHAIGEERHFRSRLRTPEEIREFCSQYDLSRYTIRISEDGNITHTGGIIAAEINGQPDECAIELVKGDGPELFHGKVIPYHARIDAFLRKWEFDGQTPPLEIRIMKEAIHLIGGRRHPYPGYYEFMVRDEEKIVFRNYQNPTTPYGRL